MRCSNADVMNNKDKFPTMFLCVLLCTSVGEDLKCALKAKWGIPITNNDEFFNALMELAPTKQIIAVSVT